MCRSELTLTTSVDRVYCSATGSREEGCLFGVGWTRNFGENPRRRKDHLARVSTFLEMYLMNIFIAMLLSCRLIQTAWTPEYAAYMIEGDLKSSLSNSVH